MKPAFFIVVFILLLGTTSKSQSDSAKAPKPYSIWVEKINAVEEKGVFYNVVQDTLEVLPVKKKYRPFGGTKTTVDESKRKFGIPAEYIRAFKMEPLGATGSAIRAGAGIGFVSGLITGFVVTPKTDCSAGCWDDEYDKVVNATACAFIGLGVGALAGWLIGKAKRKKFFIGGDKVKFNETRSWLMRRTYRR